MTSRVTTRPLVQVLLVAAGAWMLTGLFLDGWAHNAQKPDSFFTPWHAVLYSGFLAASAVVLTETWLRSPALPWRSRVAQADRPAVAGLLLFGAGGVLDLAWHEAFGIEVNLEALLSPTHLLLLTGALLAFSAPLRAAAAERDATAARLLPGLASLALVSGVVVFFTMYASPFGQTLVPSFASVTTHTHDFSRASPSAFAELREKWALAAILLTTVIFTVPLVTMVRRWRLPHGALLGYSAAFALFEMAGAELEHWPLAVAFVVGGVVAEVATTRLSMPVAAAATAGAVWSSFFGLVATLYTLRWDAELWAGVTVLAAGLSAAVAVTAPRSPESVQRSLLCDNAEKRSGGDYRLRATPQ